MNELLRALVPVAVLSLASQASAGEETRKMEKPSFVVMDHMAGALAVNLGRVESVYYLPAGDKAARLRFNFSSSENKTVEGATAEPLWRRVHEGAEAGSFLWVSHMGGTLGVPLHSIQSVFRNGEGAAMTVRINYPGDPQGKTVQGAEAAEVWKRLTE